MYVFVLDDNGVRQTSYVVGVHADTLEETEQLAQQSYPTSTIVIGNSDMQSQFLSGKIYKEGKFVDAPVVEPTATEIKKTKVAEIKSSYEEKFKTYESALMRARLAGNDAAVAKLQEVYKSDMAAMMSEMKGV